MKYVPPFGATDPNASYSEGDPSIGLRGSFPTAHGYEAMMREICNAIIALGLTPDDADFTQLGQALQVRASPTGIIAPFAGTAAPAGWLLCYGQAVSRATYATLFGVISTAYGVGDGSTTFNLPDLRGRVAAGKDDMGGAAAGRLTSGTITGGALTLGKVGGEEKHQLTTAEMANHNHALTDPGHVHGLDRANVGSAGSSYGYFGAAGTTNDKNTYSATTGITLAAVGGDTAHNNVQPTMILNYIIRI